MQGSSVISVFDEFTDLDFEIIVMNDYLKTNHPIGNYRRFEGIDVTSEYKSLESGPN